MIIEGNYFYEQESGNEQQKYVSAIDSFMREHNLYIPPGSSCPYMQGYPEVGSQACLECDSCLRFLDGFGFVCRQMLEGVAVIRLSQSQKIGSLAGL